MQENKKSMNVKVDHGDLFYTDSVTVIHAPNRFVFDFKQGSPRIDHVGEGEHQTVVIKHNSVAMDPQFAKKFFEILKENLEKYEKTFGKIKINKKLNINTAQEKKNESYIS